MTCISLNWYNIPMIFISYHDFLDKELLITGKLPNQGFLVVKSTSSPRMPYGNHDNSVDHYVCVTDNHRYVPFGVITIWPFRRSCLIIVVLAKVTQRAPLVEQERVCNILLHYFILIVLWALGVWCALVVILNNTALFFIDGVTLQYYREHQSIMN
jgi:hypothetical protein